MTTSNKLWLGFGILTGVLVLFGLTSLVRLHSIQMEVAELSEVSRARSAVTRELESETLGYTLAVTAYLETLDPQFLDAAVGGAANVEAHLADYRRLARAALHTQLAERFEAMWREVDRSGQALLDADRPAGAEDVRRLTYLSHALEHFLDQEVQPDATAHYALRSTAAIEDIEDVENFLLALLLIGLIIAVATSVSVGRGIVGAERERRRLAATLNAFIASAPVGLALLDRDLRYRRLNETFAALCGRGVKECVGNPVGEAAPAGQPPLEPLLRRVLERGEAVLGEELTVSPSVGDTPEIWMANLFPVRQEGRGILGVGVATVDISARKQAEEAQRASDQRYRSLVDVLPSAIYTCDAQGRITFFNESAAELWGQRPELGDEDSRFCGSFPLWHLDGTPLPHDQTPMAVAVRTGTSFRSEEVIIERPAGRRLFLLVNIDPLRDEHGRITGAINAFVDITDRKRAEAALRDSERRFRTLTDAMPQLVWTADPDGTVDYYNERVRQFDGFEFDDAAGRWRWNACLHPDDVERTVQAWAEAIATGGEYRVEHRVRMAQSEGDGYRWFLSLALPARDETGRITKWFGTGTDIQATKEAEAALRASEELSRSTLQALPAHIAVVDRRGTIIKVNQAWTEFAAANAAGGASAVAEGANYLEVCRAAADDDADAARALAGIEGVLQGRLPQFTLEYPCHSPTEQRWFFMTAVPLDPRGDGGSVITHLNITERKLAEQELQEGDRRKNEFLAMLAHELRNPLAPIANAVEILKLQETDDPASQVARDMIERQFTHMVRLVDDLLDVSRITRGKLQLRRQRVALADVLEQALETTRPAVEQAGQRLSLSLPPTTIEVDGDPVRLSQVFLNLLNNASKFTGPGGCIDLSAERDGDQVVVRVADTGIGIAPKHLPELFRMFSQVGPLLERGQGGLGIGLALARALVEMHGGTIEARSAGIGKGSEFIVRLPIPVQESAPGSAPVEASGGIAEERRRRILVADDNRDSARSLALFLRLKGNEVETAYDGLEAVEAAERYRPDLVLLDIGMPRMDGYAACRRIREQPWGRDLHIIALTGWGQDEDRRRSKEAGFDGHLVKPVAPSTLLATLAELEPVES